jgi:hypothetical protein
MNITESQSAALRHIQDHAKSRKDEALTTIAHILKMSNVSQATFDRSIDRVKRYATVALHFHPDRLDPEMKTVAEALLGQGIYKSQFETLLSSGSVSAHPGGERDLWEKQLYGGAYHRAGASIAERPRYGALELLRHADGPSPRFGSCYFILKPEVSQRCTFTYRDSADSPNEKGTLEEFDDILAALLAEVFTRNFALGEHNLTVPKLMDRLGCLESPREEPSKLPVRRNLDYYIEAQVHSVILLRDDVEKLIADPSFQGTDTGEVLNRICERYEIDLSWHCGFALALGEVPTDFRGPSMPSLAKRIATKPYFDVHMVGLSAASLRRSPESWSDIGSFKDVLQELKLLWHVLVKYGNPLSNYRST